MKVRKFTVSGPHTLRSFLDGSVLMRYWANCPCGCARVAAAIVSTYEGLDLGSKLYSAEAERSLQAQLSKPHTPNQWKALRRAALGVAPKARRVNGRLRPLRVRARERAERKRWRLDILRYLTPE